MRRQRETLVVVEMSPCHIFHSQTARYNTNTILIQYKYNINPTLIQYKYYANTIIICFKYYTNTTEKCHHVTYSIHRRRPRGPRGGSIHSSQWGGSRILSVPLSTTTILDPDLSEINTQCTTTML